MHQPRVVHCVLCMQGGSVVSSHDPPPDFLWAVRATPTCSPRAGCSPLSPAALCCRPAGPQDRFLLVACLDRPRDRPPAMVAVGSWPVRADDVRKVASAGTPAPPLPAPTHRVCTTAYSSPTGPAASSLAARRQVSDGLYKQGFIENPAVRWSGGIADWFVIGGRFSGRRPSGRRFAPTRTAARRSPSDRSDRRAAGQGRGPIGLGVEHILRERRGPTESAHLPILKRGRVLVSPILG